MSTEKGLTSVVENKLMGASAIVYELPTGDTECGAEHVALSPDRVWVAVLHNKRLSVYNVTTGMLSGTLEYDEYYDYSSGARFLGWSPDGTRITVVNGGFVKFYDLDAETTFVSTPVAKLAITSDEGAVRVAVSAAKELFAIAIDDKVMVYKFRAPDRHLLLQEIICSSVIHQLMFSNDNGILLLQFGEKMSFYKLATDQ